METESVGYDVTDDAETDSIGSDTEAESVSGEMDTESLEDAAETKSLAGDFNSESSNNNSLHLDILLHLQIWVRHST